MWIFFLVSGIHSPILDAQCGHGYPCQNIWQLTKTRYSRVSKEEQSGTMRSERERETHIMSLSGPNAENSPRCCVSLSPMAASSIMAAMETCGLTLTTLTSTAAAGWWKEVGGGRARALAGCCGGRGRLQGNLRSIKKSLVAKGNDNYDGSKLWKTLEAAQKIN